MYQAYGNTKLGRQLLWIVVVLAGPVLFTTFCSVTAGNGSLGVPIDVLFMLFALAVSVYAARQGVIFEFRQERTFKAVCSGIGFTAEMRSFRRGLWGAYVKGDTKTAYPKLRHVQGDFEAFTAIITPFAGQTVEMYNKHAAAFTLAYSCQHISFEPTGTGLIRMRCGPLAVPDKHDYELLPEPMPPVVNLQAVPMARKLDGSPWYMPVEENHILIAGRSGSGKNSLTWSLVLGLAPARAAGLVKLWGLDPKRVELSFGREHWDEYADTVEGMVELLEKAVKDMLERNKLIQGRARKITPSPAMPLNVLVIDELAYLSALVPDKKLRDRAQSAIGAILLLGRATGYCLVAATQDVRKEVISFRDYFLTRVALGMPAPLVDLCLGDGMWEAGARCELIPLRDAGAGSAYVLDEHSNEPFLVRAAWVSDETIRASLDLSSDDMPDLQWPQ